MNPLVKEIATTGAGVGMGLITGAINTNQQKKSQERAYRLNEQAADNAQRRAMEMWEATNYQAQRKQMEKAGLNPALMMSQGGSQPSTQAPQGNTPGSGSGDYSPNPQMGLMLGQMKLIEAQTNKTNAEAENLRGADRAKTESETYLNQLRSANENLAYNIRSMTMDEAIDEIKANADMAQSNARKAVIDANVTEETKQAQIDKIQSESINEAFKLTLMKADYKLTNEKARAISVELAQEWEKLTIELEKVGIGKMQNAINEFTAKINAKLGQGNLQMRKVEAGLNAAGKLLQKGVNVNKSGSSTTIHNY